MSIKHLFKGLLVISLVFFISFAYGCSNESQNESNTVHVNMNEFNFEPQAFEFEAGKTTTINLINNGKLEHEFMIGSGLKNKQDQHNEQVDDNHAHEHEESADKMNENNHTMQHSRSFDKDFFENINVDSKIDKGEFINVTGHGNMLLLEPGGNATLSLKVPVDYKGEWDIACFLPGHYEAGMKGKVIIR
ncbi:MAG: cupredoxin domain-containing protein [Thermodesulfobacteriota bacterium]